MDRPQKKQKVDHEESNTNGQVESSNSVITIIHFNDVYKIKDRGDKGGAARMKTALKDYEHLNPLVFFSGDAFSPSTSKYIIFPL